VPFFAFTGEGKRGEAFTRKSLMHSFLRPCGEEVKAKNEKRRTRARWALKWGQKEPRWEPRWEPAVESMIERADRTQVKEIFR